MITVQVRTPKIKISKHRTQNSQQASQDYTNLSSFHEFFNSNSSSKEKKQSFLNSRCKTENNQIEPKIKNNQCKASSQSTTISLASSTSPNQGMKKQMGNSNSSSFKLITQSKTVNPFKENGLNQKLQHQLQKIVYRTKSIVENYEVTIKKQHSKEKQMQNEINTLKSIIEQQNSLLASHNIQPIKY